MTSTATCLECGSVLKGRSDKKFCDAICRNAYNNRTSKSANNLMRNINRRLAKNRKILEELNPHGKSKTTKAKLLQAGFDFSHFTSIYETKKGARYYFVYEQGYLPLDNDWYALVIKNEYNS